MILIDTSVWADHFRSSDKLLELFAVQGLIIQHPLVTGELAMGTLKDWPVTIDRLQRLRQTDRLPDPEVIAFVQEHRLMGTGIGFIDAHILASAASNEGVVIWTRDKRLKAHAERLGLALTV